MYIVVVLFVGFFLVELSLWLKLAAFYALCYSKLLCISHFFFRWSVSCCPWMIGGRQRIWNCRRKWKRSETNGNIWRERKNNTVFHSGLSQSRWTATLRKKKKFSSSSTNTRAHALIYKSLDITTQFVHLSWYSRYIVTIWSKGCVYHLSVFFFIRLFIFNMHARFFLFFKMVFSIEKFVLWLCVCVFVCSFFAFDSVLFHWECQQLAHPFGLSFVPIWSINYRIFIEWIIFVFGCLFYFLSLSTR